MRGFTSGYAIPQYVVDAPGGGGKTPVMPNYIISQTPHKVVLRNFEGVITTYTEPENYRESCRCEHCMGEKDEKLVGIAGLQHGQQISLEPADLERNKRHHS